VELGESFVGSGPEAAHVSTVLGARDGPVGTAWVTGLATASRGHAPFQAVLQPGLPVKPATLFGNRVPIAGDDHARMTFGPAHAGVAAGVADAVAAEVVSAEDADALVLIASVWVDPRSTDAEAVFANNREATRSAIVIGRASLPAPADVARHRNDAWNHHFRDQR